MNQRDFDEENEETIKYKRLIENKNAMLTKLRDRRKQVLAMPKNRMGGEEKKQQLDKTRKLERQYLSDIKDYRKQLYGQFLD